MKKWYLGLMSGILGLFMTTFPVYAIQESDSKIHFINVQPTNLGSDAILLESNGHYGLIDAGEDYDFPEGDDVRYPWRSGINTDYRNVLTERLLTHLKNVGVDRLEFLLITHAHSDHIGNADEVMEKIPVERLYLKKYEDRRITPEKYLWDNQYHYDHAIEASKKYGVHLIQNITSEDAHFKLGDMDIQLYNYENEYGNDGHLLPMIDENSNSIISVIKVNGRKIYTGGDLSNQDQPKEAIYGPKIGKVDLMKFNHHMDLNFSNSEAFIRTLDPKVIIQTSAGEPWKNGQTDTNFINWLKNRGIKLQKAVSTEYNATVFDIRQEGLVDITSNYPRIPKQASHWYQEGSDWFYRYETGEHAIGWREIDGSWYYFTGKGKMLAHQWKKWLNHWYYFADSGAMFQKWHKIDGNWYYFNSLGQMETTWLSADGHWYYLTTDGQLVTGWRNITGKWYYFANSGEMKTGWLQDAGHWYYLGDNGEMKTGEQTIHQQQYLLANDGQMVTGWSGLRYFKDSGEAAHAWQVIDGNWYYFKENGDLLVNGITPDGYSVDHRGIWQKEIPVKKIEKREENSNIPTKRSPKRQEEEKTADKLLEEISEKRKANKKHFKQEPLQEKLDKKIPDTQKETTDTKKDNS